MNIQYVIPAGDGTEPLLGPIKDSAAGIAHSPLGFALASCHSVVQLDHREVVGDPMEVKMVEFSGWKLSRFDEAPAMTAPNGRDRLELIHRHEFRCAKCDFIPFFFFCC